MNQSDRGAEWTRPRNDQSEIGVTNENWGWWHISLLNQCGDYLASVDISLEWLVVPKCLIGWRIWSLKGASWTADALQSSRGGAKKHESTCNGGVMWLGSSPRAAWWSDALTQGHPQNDFRSPEWIATPLVKVATPSCLDFPSTLWANVGFFYSAWLGSPDDGVEVSDSEWSKFSIRMERQSRWWDPSNCGLLRVTWISRQRSRGVQLQMVWISIEVERSSRGWNPSRCNLLQMVWISRQQRGTLLEQTSGWHLSMVVAPSPHIEKAWVSPNPNA